MEMHMTIDTQNITEQKRHSNHADESHQHEVASCRYYMRASEVLHGEHCARAVKVVLAAAMFDGSGLMYLPIPAEEARKRLLEMDAWLSLEQSTPFWSSVTNLEPTKEAD
jgi:hypothetical protein